MILILRSWFIAWGRCGPYRTTGGLNGYVHGGEDHAGDDEHESKGIKEGDELF
jgi:hypothetical protein